MRSRYLPQYSTINAQPWIDWTNLTLSVFLAASPWLALGGDAAVVWNAVACGVIIAIAAIVALSKPDDGAEWTNVGFGLWLVIAPWALGFPVNAGATWTSVLVGFGVACFAGLQISLLNRSRDA